MNYLSTKIDKRCKTESILLSLPAFLIYTFIFVYPMISVFHMSFFKWNGIPSSPMQFIGIRNYIAFFNDIRFYTAVRNVLIFILSGYFLIFPISLFLAIIIHSKIRFNRFLRTSYFIPQVISRTAIALMWYFLLYPEGGPVSIFIKFLGFTDININFLGSQTWAIYTITVINAWTYAGFNMLIFSAGLSSIPDELYEAAAIDGCGSFRKFFHITLPMLKQSIQLFSLNAVIGSITTFEMVYATTGGGPGTASEVFGTLLYRTAFTYNNFGYSNAVGSFLILASLIAAIIMNIAFREGKNKNG